MTRQRYRIPSTSALVAFESAARHCNFSHAAQELYTSQSAISRHVAGLESRLEVRLFERQKQKLSLTEQGEYFYRVVVDSLNQIQQAATDIAKTAEHEQLTIACTHEISHLFLMPRFASLQQAVGEQTQIRIMTYEYDALAASFDPQIDVYFSYQVSAADQENATRVFHEALMPVCSPAFAREHEDTLQEDLSHWQVLPFLKLTKRNMGWSTWENWFEHQQQSCEPNFTGFDNYVYLLEAATAGKGIAMGWRGLVERYLESGALVALSADYLTLESGLYAKLTSHGRDRICARHCLQFLQEQALP
ncbi:LysR family transcriptional regulator [Aliamphritea spongicola]|uniref:LysR family transcriptional regulator n=1 Tax=Aliamphritea spongicola TaxID=707589 RepID=UPI00196B346F|nr:LysR family transcriptional regulator [Aliamphritea spongicola]MBN3563806.1 LysR family transcriptional regulator [Aliamphritea spongicola]